jgi:hypothetical protein
VPTVIPVDGPLVERVLDAACLLPSLGLDRRACGAFHTAQLKTSWGARQQHHFALVDGGKLLASAFQYDFDGSLDGQPVRVCGIGSVVASASARSDGHANTLVEILIEQAARDGAAIALSFEPTAGPAGIALPGFAEIPLAEVTLAVAEMSRGGAPMTLVRGGEERDLAAMAAMGQHRAGPFRLHLNRDVDLVQYAIAKKRLLAGLSEPGRRQLHFFIAEEGITAAAYVVISVAGDAWTLEECGDRDPSGARVGALLQALIAREPTERRPLIRAWLPHGFLPPQVTVVSTPRSTPGMMARDLTGTAQAWPPAASEVLYWRSDTF